MRISVARGRNRQYIWLLVLWLANPGLVSWSAPEPTMTRADSPPVRKPVATHHRSLKHEWSRSAPRSSRVLPRLENDDWFAADDLEDDVVFNSLCSRTATDGVFSGRHAGLVAGVLHRRTAPWSHLDRMAPLRC